jgi:hypothetical protein
LTICPSTSFNEIQKKIYATSRKQI